MSLSSYSDWQPWDDGPRLSERSLLETLDGGQAFRWQRKPDYLEGRWLTHTVRIRSENGRLFIALPKTTSLDTLLPALRTYFAFDTNFDALTDALPWRNDPILKAAITAFPGLRILRQPFGETLFGFLCSSTKQIPQIRLIHTAVAQSIGSRTNDGGHALPTWKQIAEAGEAPLRAAKLGYRARYIHATALFLEANPGWLEAVEQSPTDIARERLLQLPGVGRKIADCVLLFGAGRLEAFPIDTWVQKILIRAYGLEGWTLPQLQQFAAIHFGPTAGYAQQYLFAAARADLIPA